MELSEQLEREERSGSPESSGLYDDYFAAERAHESLHEAVGPPSVEDWEEVKKAVNVYADLVAAKTDGTPGRAVTGHQITSMLKWCGNPRDLHWARVASWERLDEAAKDFVPLVRGWLNGTRSARNLT
jgi:hypothetical protein